VRRVGACRLESLRRLQSLANADTAMRLLKTDILMRNWGVTTRSNDLKSLIECLSVENSRFKAEMNKGFSHAFHVCWHLNRIEKKFLQGISGIRLGFAHF
jgi:hypothetical protein